MNEVNKCINSLNINHNDNVVVAVSGGPDSMCLLNLLPIFPLDGYVIIKAILQMFFPRCLKITKDSLVKLCFIQSRF